jgi:putative ABC transport system permease protein
MRFVSIIWKNVYRRRTRSLLTICGLGVAVATVVSLVGISESFQRHFIDLYAARGVDMVVQKYGANAELSISLPDELGDRIRKIPHVSGVIGGLMDEVSLDEQNLPAVFLDGWPNSSPLFDEVTYLEGHRLRTGDFHKLIIGQELAAKTGTKIGDSLQIYGDKYQVQGIFTSKNVFDDNSMITLLPDMQEALNRKGQVTGFIIRTDLPKDMNPEERDAELTRIKQQIEALDPGHNVAAEQSAKFVESVGPIRAARAMALVVSAIALALGGIGMLNTMIMSVYERIREIGTLRAVGWRKFQVVRLILVEALVLSIAGALFGSLAAKLMTVGLSHLPAASGFVGGDIAPIVIVQGFIAALVVGVGSAIYPAIWGASLSPVEAMRRK